MRVLIVEDERVLRNGLSDLLTAAGHEVTAHATGRDAVEAGTQEAFDLVLLDLMLPDLDGVEVCRRLRRARPSLYILMLTARGEEVDRITGLTLGADDYLVKPFSPRELVARVKAVLRRGRLTSDIDKHILSYGGLVLDLEKRKVSLKDSPVQLTPHEYKLLQALMASPGRVFTRDELLDHLYPTGETVVDRVIDVHIGKLRQKIEENPSNPSYIKTVRGLGYQFEESSGS